MSADREFLHKYYINYDNTLSLSLSHKHKSPDLLFVTPGEYIFPLFHRIEVLLKYISSLLALAYT